MADSKHRRPLRLSTFISGRLDSGESLAIPEVTLLFGDGNGDGIVNIYDLAVAAFNYGESVRTLKAP